MPKEPPTFFDRMRTFSGGTRKHLFRELGAHAHHALGADRERPAILLGVVGGDGGARLHGVHDHPVVHEAQFRHMGRLGEGRGGLFRVAVVVVERDVAGDAFVKKRRAIGRRRVHVDERGQGLDLDLDRFGRVAGRDPRLGDHAGDRLADETHPIEGERRAWRLVQRGAVAIAGGDTAIERAISRLLQILPGDDGDDAGHAPSRSRYRCA